MTLIEMIQKFDAVPNKFEFGDGLKFELFIRRKTNNKGYIATVWHMVNGIQEQIVWYADGATPEQAKEKVKNKIIKDGYSSKELK